MTSYQRRPDTDASCQLVTFHMPTIDNILHFLLFLYEHLIVLMTGIWAEFQQHSGIINNDPQISGIRWNILRIMHKRAYFIMIFGELAADILK